jgi:hypothetical protein
LYKNADFESVKKAAKLPRKKVTRIKEKKFCHFLSLRAVCKISRPSHAFAVFFATLPKDLKSPINSVFF